MKLSEYLTLHADDYDWTDERYAEGGIVHPTEPSGKPHMLVTIDSAMLPGVNVDTYQSFNGDSWVDSELEWINQEGVPSWLVDHPAAQRAEVQAEWDDFDWTYDHHAILWALSEAASDELVGAGGLAIPPIFHRVELLSVYSPREYNFATDSFNARWQVDTVALVEALDDIDVDDLEDWARDRWRSVSGFSSHIPGYFDREHPWAVVWAAVVRVLIDHEYDGFYGVAEEEWNIYSEHVTITPRPEFFAKVYKAVTGEDLPDDVEVETGDALVALLPPFQEEELPITA